MMRWKRMFYYLLINVAVSACTVLSILYVWDRARDSDAPAPGELVLLVTPTPTSGAETSGDGTPIPTAPSFVYETYVVQSGDTLGAIADIFGVSIDEVMRFNNLDNPDSLSVGDILVIPVIATPTAIPSPTQPPVTRTPIPTPEIIVDVTEDAGEIEFEIFTVVGPGDLFEERVVIRQLGVGSVSLAGWQLSNGRGQTYIFPQLTLFQDGEVTVYTRAGTNTISELYWGLTESVWQVGDVVSLIDLAGDVVAVYQIP